MSAVLRPSTQKSGVTSAISTGTVLAKGGEHIATRLQDRTTELGLLRERVGDLRRGSGSVVVIEGRPGSGKSALMDAGVALARAAGSDVRLGRAREHERTTPGATLRRLGFPGTGDTATMTGDVVRLAHTGSAVVAVDDLHLADPESVAALTGVADVIEDLALLLIVALRPGEWFEGDTRLDRIRGSSHTAVLRPALLSRRGVANVFEDAGAPASRQVVARMAEWTAGNPFLVSALARAGCLIRAVPSEVGASVGRELGRLAEPEVALARALSILGSGTPLRRVTRLAELDRACAERAADRLARVGLLVPGDPLRFHAPIEAAAIADAIEPFARARAHRRAAAILLDEGAERTLVAEHLLLTTAAGEPDVVATLRAAAELALAAGRPDRAVGYLERALDEPPPAERRDETLLALVTAEALCGRPSSVDRVQRTVDRIVDAHPRAQALRELGRLLFVRDEPERAAATLQAAIEHAGGDDELREALVGDYLAAAWWAPDLHEDAAAMIGRLMQPLAAGGPLPTAPGLLVQVVAAMANGGAPRARVLPIVDKLVRANPTSDGPPFGLLADWICAALIAVDELELAERVAMRSVEAACEAGDGVRLCLASYWLGLAHLHQGRLDLAVPELEASLRRRDAGWTPVVPWAAAALCRAELERDRPVDAARALDLVSDSDPSGRHAGVLLEARGHLALAARDPAGALAYYEASGRHVAESFSIDAPTIITWRSNAVFAIRALGGDLRRAERLAGEELAQARSIGGPRQVARALRAAGAACPDTAQAIELLREARSITAAAGPRLEHQHVLADLGAALSASGSATEAGEALLELLELSELSGAAARAVRARALLRAAGMRPRRARRAGAGPLTASELRVAALAASGRTNSDIAEHLTVSERTVESHLYNTFRKLGIGRREELARHLPQTPSNADGHDPARRR